MTKFFFYISLILLSFNFSLAQDINIEEDIQINLKCDLEKKILKNLEYNYQTFFAKDLDKNNLVKFEIKAARPEMLSINGLSLLLSNKKKLNVKIVNKEIILFKAIDEEKDYSESGILNRNSGELVHEITKNIKSDNSEKDISFYLCKIK